MDQPVESRIDSPLPAKLLWAIALLLFGAIVIVNQISAHTPDEKPTQIAAPGLEDQVLMQTKLAVKLGALDPDSSGGLKSMFAGQLEDSVPLARSATQRLRLAIAMAELDTAAEAMRELDTIDLAALSEEEAPLKTDVESVRKLLRDESLTQEEVAGLRERHGYYAELALVRGKPAGDPARAAVESGGALLIAVVMFVICAAIIAFFGAIAGLVIVISTFAKGGPAWRMQREANPGTIYLESFCVFMISFAALHIGSPFLFALFSTTTAAGGQADWIMTAKLLLQLSISLTIFWPLLRGVSWERWKNDMGWRAPRGVLREIGAGFVGYFAMLPFLLVAILILLVYMFTSKIMNPDVQPPANPIAEVIDSANAIQLALLFVLMTVWAPIVEEHFFRGFLYRHLRSRFAIGAGAVLSGLFFGLMHGYGGIMLLPVITIGIGFAVIREWRGSIVPTVWGHFIHNFTIGFAAIGLFVALK
jgi:membrane protease YdiL (CAAX protease family)